MKGSACGGYTSQWMLTDILRALGNLAIAHAAFKGAIADKPAGRFMIRSRRPVLINAEAASALPRPAGAAGPRLMSDVLALGLPIRQCG
jgi:hypothetical protein